MERGDWHPQENVFQLATKINWEKKYYKNTH